jgi:predicted membrane protein
MSVCEKRGNGLFAVLLILMGALLFLENVGLLPGWRIADFWPVWMIVWGVFIIDRSRHAIALIWSGALIISGVLLILGNLNILHVNANVIWPVMLIALGVALLIAPAQFREWGESVRAKRQARWDARQEFRDHIRSSIRGSVRSFYGNSLREDVVFSSVTRRLQSQQFEGGRVAAVFGSIQLDLAEATMANGTARLKADAVFGGIEIIVPRTWKVDLRSAAVFGGCDDRSIPPRPELGMEPPRLSITGSAVFGGIVVRN